MNNFSYFNPVNIIFGKGEIAKLSSLVDKKQRIMLTYGGGSIHKNGVYDQVMAALEGYDIIEFGGIEPNPEYATLMKAVEICREKSVDMVLAVGGGSVADGSKFIAAATNYKGETPWDFMIGNTRVPEALPLGVVITLPATGSEMNCGGVISRRELKEKFAFFNPTSGFPKFSILDPTVIKSLPPRQVANGLVDTYIHTMEQYLTDDSNSLLVDRWAESILQTIIEIAPKLMDNKAEYDTYANFMLSATMALNGLLAMGTTQDWATHMIGHELTALHGLDHGATLAIVEIGIMKVMREQKRAKLLKYARRVWNITEGSDDQIIDSAIAKTEEFYRSLGMKTKLAEHNIGDQTIDEIVNRFTSRNMNVGENGSITPAMVGEALTLVK